MSNPVMDGLLRGFQIAQQIKGFQQQQENLKLARDQENRLAEQQQRQAERQTRMDEQDRILKQMETRLRIQQMGGKRLSKKQQAILDAGDDFSMEILPGFATTASSAERVSGMNGDEFLLPQMADLQRAQDAYALDRKEAEAAVGTIPLSRYYADLLGLPEGTRLKPETIDDLARANRGPEPNRVAPVMITDDAGNVRFVNPDEGRVVSEFPGMGKGVQPKQLSPSEERQNFERDTASELLANATRGGVVDVAAAETEAARRAKKDPKVRKHFQGIVKNIRELAPRQTGGAGASGGLEALLGISAEGQAAPQIPLSEALGQALSDPATLKALQDLAKD